MASVTGDLSPSQTSAKSRRKPGPGKDDSGAKADRALKDAEVYLRHFCSAAGPRCNFIDEAEDGDGRKGSSGFNIQRDSPRTQKLLGKRKSSSIASAGKYQHCVPRLTRPITIAYRNYRQSREFTSYFLGGEGLQKRRCEVQSAN
jgi:hypothetical protein